MSRSKFKQLQYECETWKRTLHFMIEENIQLKSRLSEVLKELSDDEFLSHAEKFQSDFIKHDDLIALLRNDVLDFYRHLLEQIIEDKVDIKDIELKLDTIRNNIATAEKRLNNLRADFNTCMLKYA